MKSDELPYDEREQMLVAELRARLDGAEQDPIAPGLYARVLESVRAPGRLRLVSEHESVPPPEAGPAAPRGRRLLAPFVAAVAVAAVAAAAVVAGRAPPRSPQALPGRAPVAVGPQVRSELVMAAGEVTVAGRNAELGTKPLEAGQHISTARGRACFGIDPQIDVCIDAQSEVALESLAENDVRLRVLRGTAVAALAPRARGRAFTLLSGEVSATARGTVFAVGQSEAGVTDVVVVEGQVEVSQGSRVLSVLAPHSRLRFRGASAKTETSLVGRSEESQLLALIAPRELWQGKALGMLDIAGGGGWVQASLGEIGPLPLPLRTFAPVGTQRVTLLDATGISSVTELAVAAGSTRTLDASRLAAGTPKLPSAAVPESAASLLDAARRELGRGGASAALPLYQRLLDAYPRSPEAFTVMVTVGQLELDRGAPGRALLAFDAYLRGGGALSPEALAGKIRALRALGKINEERAAIEQYLRRYPNGFESSGLRRRYEPSK